MLIINSIKETLISIYLPLCVFMFFVSCSDQEFSVYAAPTQAKTFLDTYEDRNYDKARRLETYIVEGSENFSQIGLKVKLDSVACSKLIKGYEKYDAYNILFLRFSRSTNLKSLNQPGADWLLDSKDDVLIDYLWTKGSLQTIDVNEILFDELSNFYRPEDPCKGKI